MQNTITKYEVSYVYTDDGLFNRSRTVEIVEAENPLEAILTVFRTYREEKENPNLFNSLKNDYPEYGDILCDDAEYGWYCDIEVVEVTADLLDGRLNDLLGQVSEMLKQIEAAKENQDTSGFNFSYKISTPEK